MVDGAGRAVEEGEGRLPKDMLGTEAIQMKLQSGWLISIPVSALPCLVWWKPI